MSNEMSSKSKSRFQSEKSRLLSGKILLFFVSLMLFFSCSKKEPIITWEKNTAFAEILESAGEKYIMLDFVRDG